ncbi:MAG: phage tail protein I [Desulfotalea sp.]
MSKDLKETSFADLLPSSITGDDKFKAAASALDAEFVEIEKAREKLFLYGDLDNIEEPLLTHLAYQWHVDFWDEELDINQKRQLLKGSYIWHRIKGTPAAIEMVLENVLGGGYVEEWQKYDGKPYHFRVISRTAPGNEKIYQQLLQAIDLAKNERSILDKIIQTSPIDGLISVGGVCVTSVSATISQEA